jgi:hypothetical protein
MSDSHPSPSSSSLLKYSMSDKPWSMRSKSSLSERGRCLLIVRDENVITTMLYIVKKCKKKNYFEGYLPCTPQPIGHTIHYRVSNFISNKKNYSSKKKNLNNQAQNRYLFP